MSNKQIIESGSPYTIQVIFEESNNMFKQPVIGKPNIVEKASHRIGEFVFKYLVLKGGIKLTALTLSEAEVKK